MKFFSIFFILLTALIWGGIFCFGLEAKAMPVGTLLYRTSGDGQLYGYNTDLIIDGTKLNCGHTGMYAGDVGGEEMVLEAVNNGIQLTPLKHFINLKNGEEFFGAKIPRAFKAGDIQNLLMIRDFLVDQKLAYDIDFGEQKGPDSGQFTCVGITEKIYESLNFGDKISSLDQLEYDRDNYYIDITPDGNDNLNIYNEKLGDVFSDEREFSKIAKRFDPVGLAGNGLGRLIGGGNYFFFPYTQFLQPTLKEVEVDPESLSSRFDDTKIRGGSITLNVLSQGVKNNLAYTAQISARKLNTLALNVRKTFSGAKDKLASLFSKKEKQLAAEPGWVLSTAEKVVKEPLAKDYASGRQIEPQTAPSEAFSTSTPLKEAEKTAVLGVIKKEALEILTPKKESLPEEVIERVTVEYVIDGDTIELTDGRRVRYLGIDTPELNKQGAEDDECLAWAARERNVRLLLGQEVKLLADQGGDKDKYDRLLRYVYAGDVLVNQVLAREGLGEIFFCQTGWENCPVALDKTREGVITAAGAEAQEKKRGLYSDICNSFKEPEKITTSKENKEEILSKETPAEIPAISEIIREKNPPVHYSNSVAPQEKVSNPAPAEKIPTVEASSGEASSTASSSIPAVPEDPEELDEDRVPEISTFYLFDLLTKSHLYTASRTVGVEIEISETAGEERFALADSDEAPVVWLSSWPREFDLPDREGENQIFFYLAYASSTRATSSSIILDRQAPAFNFNELLKEYEETGFLVSWDAADIASGSGLAGLEIETKICSPTCPNIWQTFASSYSEQEKIFSTPAAAGEDIFFRGRAWDLAGNKSAWILASTSIVEEKIEEPRGVLISEFATRGAGGAYDEFVELYNAGEADVDLTGWILESRGANLESPWKSRTNEGLEDLNIKTQGYLLLAPKDFTGEGADYRHGANWALADSGGALRLLNSSGEEIDLARWGEAAEAGSLQAEADLSQGGSLERKALATSTAETMVGEHRYSGNAYDTNGDNDFIWKSEIEPQNSGSSAEPGEPPAEEAPAPEPPAATTTDEIDQVYGECKKAISVNINGQIYGQTFLPEKDNLSAVAFRLWGAYSNSQVFEIKICSGEMLSVLGEEIEADWDCSGSGQALVASWIPGEENIFASEPEKYNWRKFSFPPVPLVSGEPYFIMIKSHSIKICSGFSTDNYLPGRAIGPLNANVYDLAFRTYFIQSAIDN